MEERSNLDPVEESYRQAKKNTRSSLLFFVLIVVGVFIYSLFNGGGSIISQCDDNVIGVASTTKEDNTSVFIEYGDIESAELRTSFEFGTQLSGSEEENVHVGVYQNGEFSKYTAMCYAKVPECIVIRYKEGVLVFNCNTSKLTTQQYETLTSHLEGQK